MNLLRQMENESKSWEMKLKLYTDGRSKLLLSASYFGTLQVGFTFSGCTEWAEKIDRKSNGKWISNFTLSLCPCTCLRKVELILDKAFQSLIINHSSKARDGQSANLKFCRFCIKPTQLHDPKMTFTRG